MAMVPLYERFRDLALRETRSAMIRGRRDLPDGEYGFLELYCDDPTCDCRRVLIQVITPIGPQVWTTISYGWETVEFYEQWTRNKGLAHELQGATLDPLNSQTEYSTALLRLFEYVLQDPAYVERLKRHYAMFKASLGARRKSTKRLPSKAKQARRKNG